MSIFCNEVIEDIEDLTSEDLDARESYRKGVTVRANKKKRSVIIKQELSKKNGEVDSEDTLNDDDILKSIIPGTQTIFVKTWGCTHNSSDSEYMSGLLSSYGYNLTNDKLAADLWLLNSCTVKSPAEDHFRNEIQAGHKAGKKVVVAGCVSQGAPKTEFLKGLSIIGVQQIDRVVEVVEETLKGNSVRLLGQKKSGGKKLGGAPLSLPKVRRNPLIEIIPINTGCLNQCTYCKTKHARGELGSYPPEEIISRAKQAFSEGVVELWLTSEDTGAYGRDINTNLPTLLRGLVEVIPDSCRLRIGMTNPPYILEHLEEIAKILCHERVYSFLHVPVQSGSDSVLRDMKREYCRADFEHVVEYLSSRVGGGVTIATDIICGFPTETDEDFQETLDLCSKYKFPSLFINQFFPRPGTPAAKMPRIPPKQVKERTKQLTSLFHSYEPYGDQVGSKQRVLVTEIAHDGHHFVGHNKAYQQVLVAGDKELMGRLVTVEIEAASKYSMKGRIIEAHPQPTPPQTWWSVPNRLLLTLQHSPSTFLFHCSALFLVLLFFARILWFLI